MNDEPKRRPGRPRKTRMLSVTSEPLGEHPGIPPGAVSDPGLMAILDKLATIASTGQQLSADTIAKFGQLLDGQRKALYPSNADHPEVSAFSFPEGDQAARQTGKIKALHRSVYFNGHREQLDQITPFEVELYNEFSETFPGPNSRREAHGGAWQAWVSPNNADLYITLPCRTLEQQLNGPVSLPFFLREFMDGPEATDPQSLLRSSAELKTLKARLAALEAAKGQPLIALA